VVHTDLIIVTRAQKWLATHQRNLHMAMEWSKTLHHHHNCVVINKSTKNG